MTIEKKWLIKKWLSIFATIIIFIISITYLIYGVVNAEAPGATPTEQTVAYFNAIFPTLLGFLNGSFLAMKIVAMLKADAKAKWIAKQENKNQSEAMEVKNFFTIKNKQEQRENMLLNKNQPIKKMDDVDKYIEFKSLLKDYRFNAFTQLDLKKSFEAKDIKKIVELLKQNCGSLPIDKLEQIIKFLKIVFR